MDELISIGKGKAKKGPDGIQAKVEVSETRNRGRA